MLWWRRCSQRPLPNRRPTWSASTWAKPRTSGLTRRGDSRAKLARGFGRQALEALQVVLVVVERDPQVAVDRELAELRMHANAIPLLLAQTTNKIDEPVAGVGPFSQSRLQRHTLEVPFVVAVVLEPRALARGHRAYTWLGAFGLRRSQVRGHVAQRPGPNASRVVVRDQLRHRDHQLLA